MSILEKVADWWRRQAEQAREAERLEKNKREEVIDEEAVLLFELSVAGDFAASHELAAFEHKYVAEHPCLCGGGWKMVSHDSPLPSGTSAMVCSCGMCGNTKVFVFRYR